MRRLAMVFDTETNGKVVSWRLPLNAYSLKNDRDAVLANFPRISQIAWEIVDIDTAEVIRRHEFIIKPDGWTIPTVEELKARKESDPYFFERNNISTERCEREGVPLPEVLELVVEEINIVVAIVAHNAAFDLPVLKCEMVRYKFKATGKPVEICTMRSSTDYCQLPNGRGGYKWPKLEELYWFLFTKEMEGAHDAMFDVVACRKAFIKLLELRVIALDIK